MVDLRLPRFSFRAAFELPAALEALGMKRAFGDGADFSPIASTPGDLFIDNVYHQAFVAVDEEGTEAAAATAVVITRESAAELVTVSFDRPFVFFIYDEPTGQILFAGRLSAP
jgi:serpin B